MYKLGFLTLLILLAACNTGSSGPSPGFVGLLKVTISGIGEGTTPTANAEWVKPGLSTQSATVLPINGKANLDDVQLNKATVNFSDDDRSNTRYIYSIFELTNRSTTTFQNFTLYAVNIPSNIGGTGIASMTAATGAAITSEGVARGFQPIHSVHPNLNRFEVNPTNADLQLFTPAEASTAKTQAVTQAIIPNTATVLEYGFVARNLSGGRVIAARDANTLPACNVDACKGMVTLAYKFPKVSARQNNPFSFTLYFVVANESDAVVSQSLEEQNANTSAGLSDTSNFTQTRILSGSGFGFDLDGLNNLCQVKTAVSTGASGSSDIFMPIALPSAAPGSLDTCFGAFGKRTTASDSSTNVANAVKVQPEGKIVLAGYSNNGLNNDFALVRVNPNGSLDATFGAGGKAVTDFGSNTDIANALALQSDGKIVLAGYTSSPSNTDFALARYTTGGVLDTTFGTGGTLTTAIGSGNDQASAMVLQSDGKIVVVGFSSNGGNDDFALVRYNPNGSLDTAFGTGGKVTTAIGSSIDQASGVALQSDGKIVVVGSSNNSLNYDFAVVRYNPNGTLDTAFGSSGKVTTAIGIADDLAKAVALQSDGKIVVVGASNSATLDFALVRYNTDGSLDSGFGTGGKSTTDFATNSDGANALAIQPDGKIVLAGSSISSTSDVALARYNPNGLLDTGFGSSGKTIIDFAASNDLANAIALQPDGKIVVAGSTDNGVIYFALARYTP